MTIAPDFAGFDDAQRRMRAQFGRSVTVYTTTPPTYPPGTAFDPESGAPHDPTIAPSIAGQDVAQVINARVLGGALGNLGGEEVTDALGAHSTRDVSLVLDPELYDDVKDAHRFEFDNSGYQIQSVVQDEVAHSPRVIVYGKAE